LKAAPSGSGQFQNYERFFHMDARIALVGVGLCWATTPVWVNAADWDPFGTVAIRAAFTAAVIAHQLRKNGRGCNETESKMRLVCMTGIWGALSTSCFAAAFLLTDTGKVYVLYYTFPFMVLVSQCYFAKRPPLAMELTILLLAFVGLLLVFGADISEAQFGIGEIVALASGFFWFLHILWTNRLGSEHATLLGNGIGQTIIAVSAMPLAFARAELPSGTQFALLTALGIFSAAALILWSKGIQKVPGYLAGTITMLEAPGGVLLMALIHKQAPATTAVLGGILVLSAGAVAVSLGRNGSNE